MHVALAVMCNKPLSYHRLGPSTDGCGERRVRLAFPRSTLINEEIGQLGVIGASRQYTVNKITVISNRCRVPMTFGGKGFRGLDPSGIVGGRGSGG